MKPPYVPVYPIPFSTNNPCGYFQIRFIQMNFENLTPPYSVGIDSCKAGWFVIAIDRAGEWALDIFSDMGRIWRRLHKNAAVMLVDIPIGIPDNGYRACDVRARQCLKLRASSVFPVPCRKALNARTYKAACRINVKRCGKKLSVQSWNIIPKIKEVDGLLHKNRSARKKIREAHPELCFWALSARKPMQHNKKTTEGYQERLEILQRLFPHAPNIIFSATTNFLRKYLAKDDILDALVLTLTAAAPPDTMKTLPRNPTTDSRQLAMEIVYAEATCIPS